MAVRYPRGAGAGVAIEPALTTLPVGKGEVVREAKRRDEPHRDPRLRHAAVPPRCAAAETLDATVANMRFVKPLDVELVLTLARTHDALVTVEENVVAGGAGSAVAEALAAAGVDDAGAARSACPTSSSSMAIRRCCSRSAGSMPPASSASIARALRHRAGAGRGPSRRPHDTTLAR